ncbi:ImmA/IrrE family metallo-endopeptidase [Streptomyces lydicus]|nr:ImmA/IrrE family metallo-endopeptidase [Streptomyces lydicus]
MVMQASDPCGLWIACDDADYIVYEANTSKLHQEHIIAHELAHIICCHRGTGELDEATMSQLFPDLNPEVLRDIFGRTSYSDIQEEEAEIMASLILERANRRPPGPTWSVPPEAADAVARIEHSLKNSPTDAP